ncbi:class IV lanthionine synthetase LanL [Streptomyces sp. NPDC056661]|uniref:class IV lanthionine synthetase LanL n=1 Tax=Streptomyces sp. NPDC056661 TaxID=3345898 RepID=UPI0036CCA011
METDNNSASGMVLVDVVRALLAERGFDDWQVEPGESWCRVHAARGDVPRQGWKLHVSSTPSSAVTVLSRAAEVLLGQGQPFKFAGTLQRLEDLNSPNYDRAHAGKFITVYPNGDPDELRYLAEQLHIVTTGLAGPRILSDRPYRPGSLVHYRFGVMRAPLTLSNDGIYQPMLLRPDGELVLDERKAWVAPPSWAPSDPFACTPHTSAPPSIPSPPFLPAPDLLNGRFAVHEAIRHAYKGGVFRGTDTHTSKAVIIKRGRAHVGSTTQGGDVRDLLRNEAAMLEEFAPSGITPRLVDLFEKDDSLFLVQEAIRGTTLRRWVRDAVGADCNTLPVTAAERTALGLVRLMETVHNRGLVLQDFNPNNVMVQDDDTLRLIDLEFLARPEQKTHRGFTVPYGAPEQANMPRIGPAPEQTSDLFSLGVILFFLATGLDPTLPHDEPQTRSRGARITAWLRALSPDNPAARRFTPLITALLDDDPARRPTLASACRFLQNAVPPPAWPPTATGAGGASEADPARLIRDGIDYLVSAMTPAHPQELWPRTARGAKTDPLNVQSGAAGTLAVLTRAHQTAPSTDLGQAVATAAAWIRDKTKQEARILPGLYFGRSGTAWALGEAGLALSDQETVAFASNLARTIPLQWPNPEVCHGVAGAGMTQLRFWEITGQDVFIQRSRHAADTLIEAAERRDGLTLWPVPKDFASRGAGTVHYGFAHGAAGIGAFLLAVGHATGDQQYYNAAAEAATTLARLTQAKDGAAYWPTGNSNDGPTTPHWCNGSSGVGTFLVRMWQHNHDERLLELAIQAATAVHRSRWRTESTVQCHGLAGNAEFLLDLADATHDTRYQQWTRDLAQAVHVRHVLRDGRMLLPDERSRDVSASFNLGSAGALAFLLRLVHGGPRLWLPESLAAVTAQRTTTTTERR